MSRLRIPATLAVLLLLTVLAVAEDGEKAKRRIVYVPQDEMDALVEKHGRGVMLDVEEYLKLFQAASQGGLVTGRPPATNAVVLGGRVTGTIGHEEVELTARYVVRLLTDGLQRVPFVIHGAAVGSAMADGKPALLSTSPVGSYLLLQGEGDHEVEISLTGRVVRREEMRSFACRLPTGAGLEVELTIPLGMDTHVGSFSRIWSQEGNLLTARIAPGFTFGLAFFPHREEGARTPLVHSRGQTIHRVGSRLLTTISALEIFVARRAIDELTLAVPEGMQVTEVGAPDLMGWSAAEDGRIRLALRKAVTGRIPVVLKMERSLEGPGDVVLPEVHVTQASDERGFIGVSFDSGVSGRVIAATAAVREPMVAPGQRDPRGPQPPAQQQAGQADPGRNQNEPDQEQVFLGGAQALYRYWSKDRSVTVRTELPEQKLRADITAVVSLRGAVREIKADLTYRAEGGRIFAVTPRFPPEYELAGVRVDAPVPSSWERSLDGTLTVNLPAGVAAGQPVRIVVQLFSAEESWRDESWKTTVLPLPVPSAGPGVEVRGGLAVFADEEFEVRDADLTGLESESVERFGLADARLGYRWRVADVAGNLSVTRRAPKVSVRLVAFAAPGERIVAYRGTLHYTIERAGIRQFRFVVSGEDLDRLHVTAPMNVEPVVRKQEDGSNLYVVTLPTLVKGEMFIGLSLDGEIGEEGFTFPTVKVLDVEDESGYLAVESGDNMEVRVETEGLREIGLEEMDPLIRTVGYRPSRGLLSAYQYSAHPVELTLKTVRYKDMQVLTAFVRRAHLLSLVARDGSVRTRATYEILNADRQFLTVRLQEGAAFWGALVNGKAVKPSKSRREALVPLPTTVGSKAVIVVLNYESRGAELDSSGDLALVAPVLEGVTGGQADWDVYLPSGYRVTAAGGVFGAPAPRSDRPWLVGAFGDFIDGLAGFGALAADSAAPLMSTVESEYYEGGEDAPAKERRVDRGLAATRIRLEAKPGAPPAPSSPRPMTAGEADDQAIDDPVIRDAKISDHNETDNDMPFEESLGKKDFLSDAPFDGPSTNASIGVGGGAGGTFGGRAGGRQAVPARLGRAGGMSLDIPIVPGGSLQKVSALGVTGNVNLTYVQAPVRTARGYVLSVVAALLALLVTGGLKRGSGKVPAFLWVVVVATFATFAPSWFGARDLTMWNALARGTVSAGMIMIVIGLARRFSDWARPASTAALLLVAIALFATGAEAGGNAKPAPVVDDAETVYVPYDPAQPNDLDGLGKVFIPFERFRELWNAAHPARRLEKPAEAPVPWLVTGAAYDGRVEGETVALEARYDLVVLKEDWVEVALPFSPAVVEEALVDGEPVRVLSKKGTHVLIIKGEGARSVTLRLRALLTRDGDRHFFSMALPAIPRSELTFELPFRDAEVKIESAAAPKVDGTKLTASLGPVGTLAFSFARKTEEPRIESRVELETRELLAVRDGLTQFRLQSEFRVVSGSLTEVQFDADPDFEVEEITGSDVKSWDLRDGRITVILSRRVDNATTITVVAERADGVRARSVSVPRIAPLGAVFERGVLGIAASPDLRVTLADQRNLDRVSANVPGLSELLRGDAVLHSAWRFVLRPLGLTVTTEPLKSEIRVEVPVQHLVEREWLHSRASFVFDVRGDGTFEFPVTIPADVEVESVKGEGLERWWREGEVMTFSTASPVRGRFEVHVAFRRPIDPAAERIDLPEIHARGVNRERGWILVSHAPGLSLTLLADRGLVKESIGNYGKWQRIAANQKNAYGYRQEGESYSLTVARSFPLARVTPFSTTRLQVEDDRVVVDTNFAFLIENAGEDTFKVFLPEGAGDEPILVAQKTRRTTWEDAEIDGVKGRLLTVVLQQDAIGSYEFRLVYERRLETVEGVARQWTSTIHAAEPFGENPSSYVFALNLSAGEALFGTPEGLEDADPLTFPRLPDESALPRHLILRGWQGRKAAWSLPVTLRIHSFADFPDALITSADLLTAIGRDGLSRNRMTYTVLNRTRQFLEVQMPEGADLEAVRVGGRAVKPGLRRSGSGERVLVPLSRMQVGDVSTTVEIYWSRPLGDPRRPVDIGSLRNLEIQEPKVFGLEVEQTFFTVNLPKGYDFSFDGNMQPIREAKRKLWQLEKSLEEQDLVVQVQSFGNQAQQARADEGGLANRLKMEELTRGINAADLTQEDVDRLQELLRKKGAVDETFRDNFRSRASSNRNLAPSGGGAELKQEDLAAAAAQTKQLAVDRNKQQYRGKGKSNVVSQQWTSNAFAGPETNAAIGLIRRQAEASGDKELVETWSRAFEEVAQAATPSQGSVTFMGYNGQTVTIPQQQGFMPQGEAQGIRPGRLPNSGGAGGSTGGPGGSYDGGGGGGGGYLHLREDAEKKAGLLSLPVTVPTRGRTYRFEKLNGGAELAISVGRAGGSRGLPQLGLFVLILALLAAFYRFRPDRRIPLFKPALLFVAALALAIGTPIFPLLPILAMLVAVVWGVITVRRQTPFSRVG
jgi:hypothetical protein